MGKPHFFYRRFFITLVDKVVAVNPSVSKQIGLTIPPNVLAPADKVIK
jgi:hypothetical protein